MDIDVDTGADRSISYIKSEIFIFILVMKNEKLLQYFSSIIQTFMPAWNWLNYVAMTLLEIAIFLA